MASSTSRPAWHEPRRIAALWAGILAGPIVWFTLLEVNYLLAYVSCESRHKWFFHVAVAVSVVVVGGAAWLAWRSGPPEDTQDRTAPVTRSTAEVRARWMALAGLGLSLWFILVIIAMEIPILVLQACEGR
jgi:hypothetical protein